MIGTSEQPLRLAIVGSGPAGFYTAEHVLKHEGTHAEVDMFDRLPTPYGLVRFGVAPDHPKIKSVIRVYEKTAARPEFRFFGNVEVGRDMSIEELRQRLLDGMAERGIGPAVAEDIYVKILAFSNYGFPESHAISFAYLVYASAWLKRYYPAAFTAALLRNQPMGFYAPHSLINDARRHGVTVHGVDVNASDALATLEGTLEGSAQPAIRLGLSAVRNLGTLAAERVAASRTDQIQLSTRPA